MVAKKVKNPQKSASKAGRISRLTAYVRELQHNNSQEKCIYTAARGFTSDEPTDQTAEMIALSQEAVRSKDPVNHYVLSWRKGEQPNPEQIEKAVSIFMDELGVKNHQVIYGLHANTDNMHLHLVINRVHPETLRCVEINGGFDIEAAHKAVARIEHAQGWQREQNGRYLVMDNGELRRENQETDKPRQPDQCKRDKEHRTGEKSAERIAIEEAAPVIKQAQTWEQLHRQLAEKGMSYQRVGSGALVFVGDVSIKASSVDRAASFSQLQKRLGEYQPAKEAYSQHNENLNADRLRADTTRETHRIEPIKPGIPGWDEYMSERKAHYAEKTAAKLALNKQQEQERNRLYQQQQLKREKFLQGSWKGKGDALNALRSVIAAKQAAEKAALREKHLQERAQHRQQFRPYPYLKEWQRAQCGSELAQQGHQNNEAQRIEGDQSEPPTPRDIRAFQPEIHGKQVHYMRKEEAGQSGGVAFVDKGKIIDIYQWQNQDTILAALQLAAQKWGSSTLTGGDEYKAMCIKLAVEHGFKISNPELQESIQQERQRKEQERWQQLEGRGPQHQQEKATAKKIRRDSSLDFEL